MLLAPRLAAPSDSSSPRLTAPSSDPARPRPHIRDCGNPDRQSSTTGAASPLRGVPSSLCSPIPARHPPESALVTPQLSFVNQLRPRPNPPSPTAPDRPPPRATNQPPPRPTPPRAPRPTLSFATPTSAPQFCPSYANPIPSRVAIDRNPPSPPRIPRVTASVSAWYVPIAASRFLTVRRAQVSTPVDIGHFHVHLSGRFFECFPPAASMPVRATTDTPQPCGSARRSGTVQPRSAIGEFIRRDHFQRSQTGLTPAEADSSQPSHRTT